MKTHKNLHQQLCSQENILLAYNKVRKGKNLKPYVVEFRQNLTLKLEELRQDLLFETYQPEELKTFIVREPKTRKIRKSAFRDRIVHHAICNVLAPIFEKSFIHDSFANQIGKGALKALDRFDDFKRKASRNFKVGCYVIKADIRKYFDEVNHGVLLQILRSKIRDEQFMGLVEKVLHNHSEEVGMPLGNMTSQFFANVYLDRLDQFVKHILKAKFYIRYVDDFVILHESREVLEIYKVQIENFLNEELKLRLHPTKSKILLLNRGVNFLGFRNFTHHRLLRKANLRNMQKSLLEDTYDSICEYLEGWMAYAKHGNTLGLRSRIAGFIESKFPGQISLVQIDRFRKFSGDC